MFIGKGVEVFLLLVYDVLQAFIDWCTAVSYLLQHSLKDDHIANHRIFQHVNLQDTDIVNMKWKRISKGSMSGELKSHMCYHIP